MNTSTVIRRAQSFGGFLLTCDSERNIVQRELMLLNRTLYFVRHGQSIGNVMSQDERAASSIPNHAFPLTEIGRKQAEITGEYLKEIVGRTNFTFLHSTFLRTKETAEIITSKMGRTGRLICDSRLDEKWDGIFHDLSKKELHERYPDQIRLREKNGYYHYRAPGGENGPDTERRALEILSTYFASRDSGDVMIFGHGRWFLFFQKIFHTFSVEKLLELRKLETCTNCSVTIYRALTPYPTLPETVCP